MTNTTQLQQINELITSMTEKMNSKNTIDYNLQSYIQKLQSFRILIMGDNYIDSSKIDKYLKKLSNEKKTLLSENTI